MTAKEARAQVEAAALVAIVRGDHEPDDVLAIGEALVRGGINAIEITLNSYRALDALSLLARRLGDRALIGAGTVRTLEQVDKASSAGARYLIAPGIDIDCVAAARERDLLFIPGVFTATEIDLALKHDCELLKFFPASGVLPEYLAAMRGPFPQARFMATGGIGVKDIAAYHRTGAVAFGIGSSLVNAGKTAKEIEATARSFIEEVARVRTENGAV
ncbi:MAG TPA: bifunctional 4-hydroxy-2-oxoglutarate aldolase/2-dehydro-3-deoxy-phosphogluconate aldolase [Trueperaceae bacterium]|nr:bifunctional 4-hydroxy-2-oxoglutarate aldolase/2-dehydro-3-deoxy-phosphogluconate aldolase [Trueperaceae bacterium]